MSGGGGGGSQPPSLLSSAATSLPSRLSSALSSGRGRRLPLGESTPSLGGGSMRSSSSGGRTAVSSLARRPSLPEAARYPAKVRPRDAGWTGEGCEEDCVPEGVLGG